MDRKGRNDMRIARGMMLCIGIVLVLMASMADEWEPVHILLAGGTGLALCWTAGKLKECSHEQ